MRVPFGNALPEFLDQFGLLIERDPRYEALLYRAPRL